MLTDNIPIRSTVVSLVRELDNDVVFVVERPWIDRRRARGGDDGVEMESVCGNARAAERAVGVVLQPDVDAVYVEDVQAVGDDSQLLVVFELV